MAETTTNKSFYPPTVDIAGQAVNDFLGLQNLRIAKDQALLEAQTDVAVAQQKAEGDLQKEMLKQQTKAIEAEQKAQEAARKEMQKLRADLPIEAGGLFNSHAQALLQVGGMMSQDLPGMIENLGVDGAAAKAAEFKGVKDVFEKIHTKYMTLGNDMASKTGTELDHDAGMVEGYDDVAFNESTRVANLADRFLATRDENYNYFIEDRGYKDANGNKVLGLGVLPMADWVRAVQDQDIPGLFKSQPKLIYDKTLDEAFNSIVTNNKGDVRLPSGFKTDEALDIFLDFNLNQLTPSEKNKPLFNTAISQHAINEGITFDQVMKDPQERTEALQNFRESFKQKAKDFRNGQPSASSGSTRSGETGRQVLEDQGFGVVSTDRIMDVANAFAGDAAGPVSPESMGIKGVAQTGGVSVTLDDAFVSALESESSSLSVQEAAFDADGNIFVSLKGSYAYDPFADVEAAADSGIQTTEYETGTKSVILNFNQPGYSSIIQSIGDKLLTESESDKITDFYQGLDTPDQANFYAGLMVLAKQTNPMFEQKVKNSFNTNVRGITYDELISALQ